MGKNEIIVSLILFGFIFMVFVFGLVLFIRQYRIKKRRHLEEIESIDRIHKEELLETQIEIQKQTMKYIGREIHDNIGQKLTLASLYVQQLSYEGRVPKEAENITEIGEIINQSLTELRELSKSLTNDSILNHSISELINDECRRISNLKKCSIKFENYSNADLESYQIKSILFRITQEFLQNSIRHANCKNIWVSLDQTKSHFLLILEDDGKGFDINTLKTRGIGLKNIEKRTELINGSYSWANENKQGTKLTIKIPF